MKQFFVPKLLILLTLSICFHQAVYSQQADNAQTPEAYKLPVKKSPFTIEVLPDSTGQKFTIYITNPDRRRIALSIVNANYGYLFTENVKDDNYSRRFDMSQTDDGVYEIEASCGSELLKRNISIRTSFQTNRSIKVR